MYTKKDLTKQLNETKDYEKVLYHYRIYTNEKYTEYKEKGFKSEKQEKRYQRKNQTYNLIMKDYADEIYYFAIICEEWANSYRKEAIDILHELRVKIGRMTENDENDYDELSDILFGIQYEVGLS